MFNTFHVKKRAKSTKIRIFVNIVILKENKSA